MNDYIKFYCTGCERSILKHVDECDKPYCIGCIESGLMPESGVIKEEVRQPSKEEVNKAGDRILEIYNKAIKELGND